MGYFKTMSVQPEDLRGKAERVLNLLGVKGYSRLELTYALKTQGSWRVNFSYEPSDTFYKKLVSFQVNAVSGEIEGMWLDRVWN